MSIVRVENGTPMTERPQNTGKNTRIEAGSPPNRPDLNSLSIQPAGQLGISTGDDDLMNAQRGEFPGQEPDLPLSATPLPTGSDVDDGGNHVLGSTSAGKGSPSRTTAWGPLSRTTSANRLLSSARLNGLCR